LPTPPHPGPPPFPYTTLFRSTGPQSKTPSPASGTSTGSGAGAANMSDSGFSSGFVSGSALTLPPASQLLFDARHPELGLDHALEDRKSTRLNSSHVKNSYAVF